GHRSRKPESGLEQVGHFVRVDGGLLGVVIVDGVSIADGYGRKIAGRKPALGQRSSGHQRSYLACLGELIAGDVTEQTELGQIGGIELVDGLQGGLLAGVLQLNRRKPEIAGQKAATGVATHDSCGSALCKGPTHHLSLCLGVQSPAETQISQYLVGRRPGKGAYAT